MKTFTLFTLIGAFCTALFVIPNLSQYFDGDNTDPSDSIIIEVGPEPGNIWQVGPPQKILFENPYSSPNVLITDTLQTYPPNNKSSFSFSFSSDWAPIVALQWAQQLDIDEDFDGGVIEFSTDTGQTWQNAFNNPYVYNFYGYLPENVDTLLNGDFAFNGRDSLWRDIWLCFDSGWFGQFEMIFRYTFRSDSIDNDRDGWMIDNMSIHPTQFHTIREAPQEEYLIVQPNPTGGRLDISTKKMDGFHIIEYLALMDLNGNVLQEFENIPTKFWLDIRDYPDGVYLLNVRTNIESSTTKVILQK